MKDSSIQKMIGNYQQKCAESYFDMGLSKVADCASDKFAIEFAEIFDSTFTMGDLVLSIALVGVGFFIIGLINSLDQIAR